MNRSSSSITASVSTLTSLLKSHISQELLSTWGVTPGTKTIHNLHLEIRHGESTLTLSPAHPPSLLRTVHVATLHIKNPAGATLIESRQLLSDGAVRPRNRPLSEKMKPGESIEDAATRAVKEELGGGVTKVEVVMGSYQVREEERDSVSYPGLQVRYVLHSVEVRVAGIPEDGEFETEEDGEGMEEEDGEAAGVFVRKHFWKWVQADVN